MGISAELMYAILALDSYNRSYNPGIQGFGGKNSLVGDAIVGNDSSVLRDAEGNRLDEDEGFYAAAYNYNGETVISYRGTDSIPELTTLTVTVTVVV